MSWTSSSKKLESDDWTEEQWKEYYKTKTAVWETVEARVEEIFLKDLVEVYDLVHKKKPRGKHYTEYKFQLKEGMRDVTVDWKCPQYQVIKVYADEAARREFSYTDNHEA